MAWDTLWNWLGTYSSTFSILPSPTGLLSAPSGSAWSDGGGTWDRKSYIINNNPTEIGVNFSMHLSSVVDDGWFYLGAHHSAEAGFVAHSPYMAYNSTSEEEVAILATNARKTWTPYSRSKDGLEVKKDLYSYDYGDMDSLHAEVQDSLKQRAAVWVPSSEVYVWVIGRTQVKVI